MIPHKGLEYFDAMTPFYIRFIYQIHYENTVFSQLFQEKYEEHNEIYTINYKQLKALYMYSLSLILDEFLAPSSHPVHSYYITMCLILTLIVALCISFINMSHIEIVPLICIQVYYDCFC